jgi:hypothetical protein
MKLKSTTAKLSTLAGELLVGVALSYCQFGNLVAEQIKDPPGLCWYGLMGVALIFSIAIVYVLPLAWGWAGFIIGYVSTSLLLIPLSGIKGNLHDLLYFSMIFYTALFSGITGFFLLLARLSRVIK